jgi:hypothetical protein
MPVSDKLKLEQGHVVRERSYPLRKATLELNKKLQSADVVADRPGARAFANFPEHELQRLADKARTSKDVPRWYADLNSPDQRVASRAKVRLVNSKDGECYRVGGTSKKSFRFKNNPLAKDA